MFKKLIVLTAAFLTLMTTLSPAGADATSRSRFRVLEVTVTVENLAPADGTAQTPVWVGIHDGSFDIYDRGVAATRGLESLAEDGATDTISAEFAASGAGIDSTIASSEGIPPLLPGESGSFTFFVEATRNDPQYLSYASMVLPSNDAFIANGDPLAHQVIDDQGRFVPADFVVTGGEVLDAGTEVNDELEASTAFFGQAAPNTGVTEGAGVELHPGFIPGGRILSEPRFAAADFTADGYESLRVTTSAVATNRFEYARADGDQAVPAVDSDALGVVFLKVRRDGTIAYFVKAKGLEDLTLAHIHLGAPGETGPVVVDLLANSNAKFFGRDGSGVFLRGRIAASDLVGELDGGTIGELWQAVRQSNAYVNLHTENAPAGEIRADLG